VHVGYFFVYYSDREGFRGEYRKGGDGVRLRNEAGGQELPHGRCRFHENYLHYCRWSKPVTVDTWAGSWTRRGPLCVLRGSSYRQLRRVFAQDKKIGVCQKTHLSPRKKCLQARQPIVDAIRGCMVLLVSSNLHVVCELLHYFHCGRRVVDPSLPLAQRQGELHLIISTADGASSTPVFLLPSGIAQVC
jgi:hypothetical protein